jgi:hypothetical protein
MMMFSIFIQAAEGFTLGLNLYQLTNHWKYLRLARMAEIL